MNTMVQKHTAADLVLNMMYIHILIHQVTGHTKKGKGLHFVIMHTLL